MTQQAIADMHIHTEQSDGALSVTEVIQVAQKIPHLKTIAITDHDTAAGSRIALKEKDTTLDIISGIEFSCDYFGEEVHILGYFIDCENPLLYEAEEKMLSERKRQLSAILERLNKDHMPITEQEVYTLSKTGVVGRPHIAGVLVQKGYAPSIRAAFRTYLSRGCKTYVPRNKMSIEQTVRLIGQLGGISVLAHPNSIYHQSDVIHILNKGLQGIEVYHPLNTPCIQDYLKLAKERSLFVTGGSDFHAADRISRALIGQCSVAQHYIDEMKAYHHSMQNHNGIS